MKNSSLVALLSVVALACTVDLSEAGGKRKRKPRISFSVNLGVHRRPRRVSHPVGHYEWREERVWIPGHHETKWIVKRRPDRFEWREVQVKNPDRYEWREQRVWVPGGTTYRTERYLICAGHWETRFIPHARPPCQKVWIPPQYGSRQVEVELPGHWEVRRQKILVPGEITTRRERVRIPGETYRVKEHGCLPGHYETRKVMVWVPGATCAPRKCIRIGGNHGGFGFSLNL